MPVNDLTPAQRRRSVVIAGHSGSDDDQQLAVRALDDHDASVRAAALGALERMGLLTAAQLEAAFADAEVTVRRRASEIAAQHRDVDLVVVLDDDDPRVIEMAAWACGEHEDDRAPIVDRLLALATDSPEALVRESAVAALGAIGTERAVDVIIAACSDKPAVRRRAVLALAPFIGDPIHGERVDATIEASLEDRDWQVRQAAEDLRRITGSD